MLTMSGYRPAGVMSIGLVRNASTSNRLSFDMNVNDSTSASCLERSTAAFRSVIRRGAADPTRTYSSA